MTISTNEFYIGFSFIGFVLSAIPLYWHIEARNMGTSLYMIWTGLGCLFQCVNSIVWNKNMTNRAPIYCDIALERPLTLLDLTVTHIQVAQNVAIPASSLCINRRLYKIAMAKAVKATKADKRRAIIQDLLVSVGIPVLQIIAQYIVSSNRYDIIEDYGPHFTMANTPLVFVLFSSWPIAIGTISLYYCVRTIYRLYNSQRQFRQIMSSSQGFSSGLYIRLMALSSIEILGTIPIGTYVLVINVKEGVGSWESWASMHGHYSAVYSIPESDWKSDPPEAIALEMYRWLLVVCAFIFFAFFGFAEEARQNYRRVYTSLASLIGQPKSTLRGSSHTALSAPCVNSRSKGGVDFSVTKRSGENKSSVSLTDDLSIQSDFVAEQDLKSELEQDSPPNSASSSVKSLDESRVQGRLTPPPAGITPTVTPAHVPPHFPNKTKSTIRTSFGIEAV